MPEQPDPKPRPHPWAEFYREPMLRAMHNAKALTEVEPPRIARPKTRHAYAELHCTSNFTFLTGASHAEELVEHAAELGHRAVAITDCNTLAGIVRAHVAAKSAGMPLIVGSRLALTDDEAEGGDISVLVYPTSAASYGRLCRLLTLGKLRAEKGECRLTVHDLVDDNDGLLAVIVPPAVLDQRFIEVTEGLRRHFTDDRLSLAASFQYGEDDRERIRQVSALAAHVRVPLVATNDVQYHTRDRKRMHDVLACIRHGCTLDEAGFRIAANAERCLKPPDEMARLFADQPRAIRRTIEIADRAAAFSLEELRYQYPEETCPPGRTPMQHLVELTRAGARKRYPRGVPDKVQRQIDHEYTLIDELNYAPYFLTVHDLVMFARSRNILCQGRGAAANSAVCYCLEITAVDPSAIDLLFERFVSRERNEPPDIDIDFEHERREEVIQYIYSKYGRDRAALTGVVTSYRGRSAVREVGKAFGLSLDCVERLAKDTDWWSDQPARADRLRQIGLDPTDPTIAGVMELSKEIMGFPRHLSQHVGGFVITRGPLCEMVPVENARMPDRTVIEWDKDDIDAMGMLKVDVLGLGMLTCVRKAFELVEQHHGRALTLATVPQQDDDVYDMICRADTVGVFQIESRAQMQMLPRLRPRCYYDLVIEVAIVRPGPIQGDMVHPYLRRRNGEEPIVYPHDDVRQVLGKTLGVPLFQEQAMALAMVAAGFSPDEADQLRRAMAAWKRKGDQFFRFEERFVNGMLERGYERSFADRCFQQLKGFSEYGFPESHAASFALIVYVSSWLKHHHPAAFAAALINSQPMGFYAPAQIVRDAIDHGVRTQPVDVNHSRWDCTLEAPPTYPTSDQPSPQPSPQPDLRLGLRLIKGLRQEHADAISAAVARHGPFDSIETLHWSSGVPASVMRRLAGADAFGSMGLDRQSALWHVRTLSDTQLPLFGRRHAPPVRREIRLPVIAPLQKVMFDYGSTGLSLKAHPVSFVRDMLTARRVATAADLQDAKAWPQGKRVSIAGLALVRQRPATASGIVFMTLEDETGTANLIIRPHIYERYRRAARHGLFILAHGTIERQGMVIHTLVTRLEMLDDHLAQLATRSRDFR